MKGKDIGERVRELDSRDYGEGWGWKRVLATVVLATAIVGGATYGAMQSYTPVVKTERRTEARDKQVQQPYEKKVNYVAVEQ